MELWWSDFWGRLAGKKIAGSHRETDDQDNNIAVLQEAKVNPSGLAGINANLAYGCMKGNCATQSDVVRAYTQSILNSQVPTWVELPIELVPKEFRGIKRPCVRLWKSLYGHPEAGYHWDQRFKQIMGEIGAVHCAGTFQSTYQRVSATVDFVRRWHLAERPQWKSSEILGNAAEAYWNGRSYSGWQSFGKTSHHHKGWTWSINEAWHVRLRCKRMHRLRRVEWLCVEEGHNTVSSWRVPWLVDSDFAVRGEMAQDVSKVLMKILWRARLARPDLIKGIYPTSLGKSLLGLALMADVYIGSCHT